MIRGVVIVVLIGAMLCPATVQSIGLGVGFKLGAIICTATGIARFGPPRN